MTLGRAMALPASVSPLRVMLAPLLLQLASGAGLRGAAGAGWLGKASLRVAADFEPLLDLERLASKVSDPLHSDPLDGGDAYFRDVTRLQRVARAMDSNNDTHVTVEEMREFAKNLKERQRWDETSAAFRSADLDGSGEVRLHEVQALAMNSSLELAAHQMDRFQAADADADGSLSISEFHAFLHPEVSEQVFSVERDHQFAFFDADGSGGINFQEFCRGSRAHGDKDFDADAAREDFELHDGNADGQLSLAEFGRLLAGHDLLTDSIMKAVAAGDSDGDGRIHVDSELPSRLQHLLESEFVEDFFFHKHAGHGRLDEL